MTDPGLVVPAAIGLASTLIVTVVGWLWNLRQKRLDEHAKLLGRLRRDRRVQAVRLRRPTARPSRTHTGAHPHLRGDARRPARPHLPRRLVRGTSRRVSESYDALVGETRKVAGTAVRDGWSSPAIATDEQMNMPEVAAALAPLAPHESQFLREVQRYLQPVRSRLGLNRKD